MSQFETAYTKVVALCFICHTSIDLAAISKVAILWLKPNIVTDIHFILVTKASPCNESVGAFFNLCSTGEDKYVAFVSGLSVGSNNSNPLQLQLFIDHITGHLGDEKVYPDLFELSY